MRRRAVIVRCGWGAAVLVCVSAVLALTRGRDDREVPPPAAAPRPGALVAPRMPPFPAGLVVPDREFFAALEDPVPVPPREYPAPTADRRPPVPPPMPAQPVVPAGGMVPVLPVIPAGGFPVVPSAPTTPSTPATLPAPVIPPAPAMPPTPTIASVPTMPAPPAIPVPPTVTPIALPVKPAASAVPGAPTAPVVPVPTMATMPAAPMPVSPAAYPPASLVPAPVAPPSVKPGPAAPVPAAPAPVMPASVAPSSTGTVPSLPPSLAAPVPMPAPLLPPTHNVPIHPSMPATFPQPDSQPATPGVLPTPAELQRPAEPAPNLGAAVNTLPASGGPGADGTPLNDYWRHGLRFESADKDFSIFIGGRFQFDTVGYLATTAMRQNIPGNVPLEDGVSFRRFRLDMGGTLYRNMEYFAQVDFFNGFVTDIAENRLSNVPAPTDLWVQFTDLPVIGSVRVGNQKPLYSFEHLTSSRFLNFLERSLGFDAFVENFNNGFAPGISLLNTFLDRRGTAGIGLFKNTRSPFAWNVGRNEAEVNGRVTFLPVYAEDGKYLVHVGVGAAHRDLDQDQVRFRSRLDARNSPSAFSPLVADTGLFFGHNQQLLIPELVMVAGPWSFQSEYYASWVQGAATVGPDGLPLAPQGTVYMQSAYGEVHYFLTGEYREYNRNAGVFTRVVPHRPLAWSRCGFTGCGAWQLTARYSYLDLIDKGINGGRIHDMTLGLNWFLNPNMKVQWNYFLAHRNVTDPAGDGFIQGFATRLAIDF